MEYFAGLDVSMEETHLCVVTRNGAVMHEAKVPSTPASIAAAPARVPACRRILFETGRMAPMLYHGLSRLGLPVVCEPSSRAERRPWEGADDGADSVACGQFGRLRFQPSRSAPS